MSESKQNRLGVVIKPRNGGLIARCAQLTATDGTVVATQYSFEPTDVERFERLAAAWNACEGIPTEALDTGVVQDLIEALKAQEAYDDHCGDCDQCQEGSLCDEGEDLSTTAQAKRVLALSKAEGRE
jgi:hypothetical protein